VVNELVATIDVKELDGIKRPEEESETEDGEASDTDSAGDAGPEKKQLKPPAIRRVSTSPAAPRSEAWKRLTKLKDRIKRWHRNVNWLRMVDVVATNSSINVVDVGTVQFGSFTVAVDTRRKMVDRARFFFWSRGERQKQNHQAEWILTLKSVLFTVEGRESLEVLDNATLNVHGFLYVALDGLRDASIALKLGRVHLPLDDIKAATDKYKRCRDIPVRASDVEDTVEAILDNMMQELDDFTHTEDHDLVQTVSDSKEFATSLLRGIKEVQFAVSFVGFTKKAERIQPNATPLLLTASMKEVGVDLHRLDPKSPAHQMYFPSKDIAHEALAAALSISIGLDDGGKPCRLLYIPMATTTVKTTLPSKTVQLAKDGSIEERNANILFANSVVTSPSIDLDPSHLPLLIALLKKKPKQRQSRRQRNHMLISRLLPKASIKFSMHEPVVRISLPPVEESAEPDDFDLIISSISSISWDIESFHSTMEHLHYSLASAMRLQSHHLYYQTSSGVRFDLLKTETFDQKVQISAAPDVRVVSYGNLQSFAIKLVRPEIADGLREIVRQLRLDVEPKKLVEPKKPMLGSHNFIRFIPAWLSHFQIQTNDFSIEVAGIDENLSDETRGISLQVDSMTAEYTAQKVEGLRRPSRRRGSTRSITPDNDIASPPQSPLKRHQHQRSEGDGRRVSFNVRGLEVYMIEAAEKLEVEPFIRLPRFEVAFSALSDKWGPLFHLQANFRSILMQYSLYRHYAVGVATIVLRKAFMKPGRELYHHTRHPMVHKATPSTGLLAPLDSPHSAAWGGQNLTATPLPEFFQIDLKVALVQIKGDMPNDPPLMLQIYGMEAGRQRFSLPFFFTRLARLYVEAPRMRRIWARVISIKNGRVEYRQSKRKLATGGYMDDKSIDITTDAIRVAVPHEVIVHRITDNFINVLKSVQQLHHRFKTGTNEYILDKKPEGPRILPKMSLRSRSVLLELEDGGFEWKLGMIYRVGRIEQLQRLARAGAFELKMKRVREEESRKESSKFRARSTFQSRRSRDVVAGWRRAHSADGHDHHGSADEGRRGRVPRYDPEMGVPSLTGNARLTEKEGREKMDVYNSQSWKRRIDRACAIAMNAMKESRSHFWGPDHLPEDLEDAEPILEVPERPALLSALVSDLQFAIDKPSFPLSELPDFLHKVGKGMPRDMQYSLLVPLNVQIEMNEARICLRDYPLPFIHIPPMKSSQSSRFHSLSLKTDFVIAEEFRGPESTRRLRVQVIPPKDTPSGGHDGGFAIDVRRTIGPVKSYSDMHVEVNSQLPTRITWGPCYQPAMQDMMMVIESFTKPPLDPSERVGFWDKIRLNFHSRIHVAWRGDTEVHLSLKGTRDPYLVTGNGAGFLMCWKNDVRLELNAEDDPKRFMTVNSGEYTLAIPDYSHNIREEARRSGDTDMIVNDENHKYGATYKKVAMKLSGNVQWMIGLVFERAIVNGARSFDFTPHYEVVLKSPLHAKPAGGLPYDALRGFRSQHIHLSIGIRAPVDRNWASTEDQSSKSYNSVHFTPRFFTHFFAWWSLFGGPLSLPIRQGALFPGREKNSKKFGRHLATVKYNLLLAPLFLSHIYKHKDAEEFSEDAVSATGLKVRFDSFMLDLHQRREEFNTRDRGWKTQSRTSGIKIHAAQLDLVSADVRAVSASMRGTTTEAIKKGTLSTIMTEQEDGPDHPQFEIPDVDSSWIDFDDFVELDWILPAEKNPDTKILPLAYAPRLTYFRQTDIGGLIAGDPDRTSPFGREPTHFCIMSQDDPRRVQIQLIQERLSQLDDQIDSHEHTVGEAEFRVMQDGGKDAQLQADFEALRHHSSVLQRKKAFLESMLNNMTHTPSESQPSTNGSQANSDMGVDVPDGSITLPSSAEFESDFKNRFVIHNMQLKWNNILRNIVLRYIHQNSQRRGFVYYLSRPAVKFILDIVAEQAKAKPSKAPKVPPRQFSAKSRFKTKTGGSTIPEATTNGQDLRKDIEDRIKKILQDGKKFVEAPESSNVSTGSTMADLIGGISKEFTPQSSYHVRLIAPQIQLQSDKNKKHVVLITAKGMEMKVVEVMDKARISDSVSGLVQRRFLLNMDSAQFFVTHQKWFQTHLVSMYAGSRYGTPNASSWPPWVPMEVMFDFTSDPFGFKRVVQKTSAQLRYDKYNTLRLKYNDEVNTDDTNTTPEETTESRMDNLWVEFPQARALCNSSQYYAMYVIVLDLLMYSEPLEKTRSERLEKIMLASDFSDLSGAPEMVQKLQERVRQLEEIKTYFQIHSRGLDKRGWEDRLVLERDLAACEDDLFFLMKAITTSQRKHEAADESQISALLKWNISAKDIVWHLIKDSMEPLVELQLRDVEYDRTDNADGSHINLVRVGKILGLNLLPNATYPEIIAPYVRGERGTFSDVGSHHMIRVCWHMLEAIAGIPVMDHFEVNLFPMKIQLEREVGKQLFEYIFPNMDGEGPRNDSPFLLKKTAPGIATEDDEDASMTASSSKVGPSMLMDKDSSFSTRPGSLELRLQPTLASHVPGSHSPKKALSVHAGDGHSFRLFRSAATSKIPSRKPSYESMKSVQTPRPGIGRTGTGASSKDPADPRKVSRFVLRNRVNTDDKIHQQASDDLTKMMLRASNYMTFTYIKMPSVELCLSYKGKDNRNVEDVHDFVFRMPTIEWRNKTWSNLDLALALKKAVMKALISHTGAIIGNKFSKHRPSTAQTSKLRELASHSAVITTPAMSSAASGYNESLASDDSSSLFGTSPVDFSRSPPRSVRSSTHSSIPGPKSASRSSSVASTRSYRTGSSGHGVVIPGHPPVPSFLLMTPPTPQDAKAPGFTDASPNNRPVSHRSLKLFGGDNPSDRPSSSASTVDDRKRRRSAGSSYLKGKISAFTSRLSRESTARAGDARDRSRSRSRSRDRHSRGHSHSQSGSSTEDRRSWREETPVPGGSSTHSRHSSVTSEGSESVGHNGRGKQHSGDV